MADDGEPVPKRRRSCSPNDMENLNKILPSEQVSMTSESSHIVYTIENREESISHLHTIQALAEESREETKDQELSMKTNDHKGEDIRQDLKIKTNNDKGEVISQDLSIETNKEKREETNKDLTIVVNTEEKISRDLSITTNKEKGEEFGHNLPIKVNTEENRKVNKSSETSIEAGTVKNGDDCKSHKYSMEADIEKNGDEIKIQEQPIKADIEGNRKDSARDELSIEADIVNNRKESKHQEYIIEAETDKSGEDTKDLDLSIETNKEKGEEISQDLSIETNKEKKEEISKDLTIVVNTEENRGENSQDLSININKESREENSQDISMKAKLEESTSRKMSIEANTEENREETKIKNLSVKVNTAGLLDSECHPVLLETKTESLAGHQSEQKYLIEIEPVNTDKHLKSDQPVTCHLDPREDQSEHTVTENNETAHTFGPLFKPKSSKVINITNIPLCWDNVKITEYIKRSTQSNEKIVQNIEDIIIEKKDSFMSCYVEFSSRQIAKAAFNLLITNKVKILGNFLYFNWSTLPQHCSAAKSKTQDDDDDDESDFVELPQNRNNVYHNNRTGQKIREDAYSSKALYLSRLPLTWEKTNVRSHVKSKTMKHKDIIDNVVKIEMLHKDNTVSSFVEFSSHDFAKRAMKLMRFSRKIEGGVSIFVNWSTREDHKTARCSALIFDGIPITWEMAQIRKYIHTNTTQAILDGVDFIYLHKENKVFTGSCLVRFLRSNQCTKAFKMLSEVPLLPSYDGIYVKMDSMFDQFRYLKQGKPDYAALKMRLKKNAVQRSLKFQPAQKLNKNPNVSVAQNSTNTAPVTATNYPPVAAIYNPSNPPPVFQTYNPPASSYKPPVTSPNVTTPASVSKQPASKWDMKYVPPSLRVKKLSLSQMWSEMFEKGLLEKSSNSMTETFGLRQEFLDKLGIRPPISNKIIVYNVDYNNSLERVFGLAGVVRSITECTDPQGLKTLCVEYDHPVEAVQAVSMFNKRILHGNMLKVVMDTYESGSSNRPLPPGLLNIGPGLGFQGSALKEVRSTIESLKIKELLTKEQSASQNNSQANQKPNDISQLNNLLTTLVGLQNNPLKALSDLLNPQALQNTSPVSQQNYGANTNSAPNSSQRPHNDRVSSYPLNTSHGQNTQTEPNMPRGMNIQSGIPNDPSAYNIGRNIQTEPNFQSSYNPHGSRQYVRTEPNMRGGMNIQGGIPNDPSAYNLHSGQIMQSEPNVLSAHNLHGGQHNKQTEPYRQSGINTQGGVPNVPSAYNLHSGPHTPTEPNMQSEMNIQGGIPNVPGYNMHSGPHIPTEPNIQSGMNIQGGIPNVPGYNMHSGPHIPTEPNIQSGMNIQGGIPNVPGYNMHSGPHIPTEPNIQSGMNIQGGIPNVPGYNMHSGPHIPSEPNMQSGMNIQGGILNVPSGYNLHSGQIVQTEHNIQIGMNTQGGIPNVPSAYNLHSGHIAQTEANMQSGMNIQGGIPNVASAYNLHSGQIVQTETMQSGMNIQGGIPNAQGAFDSRHSPIIQTAKKTPELCDRPASRKRPLYDDFGRKYKDKDAERTVMFKYLPPSVTLNALKSRLQNVGNLKEVNLLGPGSAKVVFYKTRDARKCIDELHKSRVDGQTIEAQLL